MDARDFPDTRQGVGSSTSHNTAAYARPAARRRFIPRVPFPHLGPVRVRTFDSFGYRNYVFLWLSTLFASSGFWLQLVVVGWLTYQVTESAFWTTLALSLDTLPILLVGPVGGLLADNFDRRKLLVFIHSYQAVLTAAFAAVVLTGNLEAWHIFAFIFFMGLGWVITDPTHMSLIPNIVPRDKLINAFALKSLAISAPRLAVPALGGVMIVFAGPGITLTLEAALQVCAVLAVLQIRVPKPARPSLHVPSAFRELRKGVRYVLNEPVLIGLFALAATVVLLAMPLIHGLMPVYAAEVFHVDARGLGLLMSAAGAGSTLGTFVLASVGDVRAKHVLVLASIGALVLASAIFSVNAFFHTAYLNLMIISAAIMVFMAVGSAIVQSTVSDEYRGRVGGLFMMTWGLLPLGSLFAGFMAERFGAPHATQVAAAAMLLMFGLAVWRIRALRQPN